MQPLTIITTEDMRRRGQALAAADMERRGWDALVTIGARHNAPVCLRSAKDGQLHYVSGSRRTFGNYTRQTGAAAQA